MARYSLYVLKMPLNTNKMKKRSGATQTLRARCSKTDPHTNRQGRLQYTAQRSAQCNKQTNKYY